MMGSVLGNTSPVTANPLHKEVSKVEKNDDKLEDVFPPSTATPTKHKEGGKAEEGDMVQEQSSTSKQTQIRANSLKRVLGL